MVGRGLESDDVVCHLLDTATCANKPQYIMAPEARPSPSVLSRIVYLYLVASEDVGCRGEGGQ